jgi:hypothetical protein
MVKDINSLMTKKSGSAGKGFLYGSAAWSALWLRAYFTADNRLDRDPGYLIAAILLFPVGGLAGMLVSTIAWRDFDIKGDQKKYELQKEKLVKRALIKSVSYDK